METDELLTAAGGCPHAVAGKKAGKKAVTGKKSKKAFFKGAESYNEFFELATKRASLDAGALGMSRRHLDAAVRAWKKYMKKDLSEETAAARAKTDAVLKDAVKMLKADPERLMKFSACMDGYEETMRTKRVFEQYNILAWLHHETTTIARASLGAVFNEICNWDKCKWGPCLSRLIITYCAPELKKDLVNFSDPAARA